MSIFIWLLKIVMAFFCISGAAWRFANFDQAKKDVPSIAALPRPVWHLIGAFEILAALGIVLPGLISALPQVTGTAAMLLAIELLLITALHLRHFGPSLKTTNPAVWTFSAAVLSAVIAISA